MLTLYITRHGETEWNKEKRMQGWLDSNLTEDGKNSAISLGERLKDIQFTAVFSSPSGRTKTTTELILGDREIPVHYDENLKEMNLGQWEGKTQNSIYEANPYEFEAFWDSPHLFSAIDGENFDETQARALKVLNKIKKDYSDGNVLIVTHTVIIKCLLSIFKNDYIENLWDGPYIHDTSLTKVQVSESGYTILLEGDISHKQLDKV
ncbi:histidine phosphatase family protein [Solibacillus sp. CAU 1738]|uniref:histidine phosphatase family protein n=1 Tax=Solibacillus sp. CAU 1738 TaxID=3140363 RepID=UPI0032612272